MIWVMCDTRSARVEPFARDYNCAGCAASAIRVSKTLYSVADFNKASQIAKRILEIDKNVPCSAAARDDLLNDGIRYRR